MERQSEDGSVTVTQPRPTALPQICRIGPCPQDVPGDVFQGHPARASLQPGTSCGAGRG